METSLILLLCIASRSLGHRPKVHEDSEYTASEITRNTRYPSSTRNSFKAPAFDYQSMPQQDQLKARYAQQQQIDAVRVANFYKKLQSRPLRPSLIYKQKHPQQYNQPQSQALRNNGTFMTKDENDWIPIEPTFFKQSKPGRVTNTSYSGPVIYTLYGNKNTAGDKTNNLKNILLKNGREMEAAGSSIMEEVKVERNDHHLPSEQAELIYVHPTLLRQGHRLNLKDDEAKAEAYVLNDLIGKNPNIQLEELKRLLQSPEYILPLSKIAKPFEKTNDNIHINENIVDISSHHQFSNDIPVENPTILAKLDANKPITADQLKELQKQLDEASKLQTEKVLARAQQEAQAQVEAQHKAIAAAQRNIYQNVQSGVYNSPQAFALVQSQAPQAPILNYKSPVLPTPIPYHEGSVRIQSTTPESQSIQPSLTSKSEALHKINSVQVSSTSKPELLYQIKQNSSPKVKPSSSLQSFEKPTPHTPKVKPAFNFFQKNTQKYAPNHIHESEVQQQAEKALLAQVERENNAILSKTLRTTTKDKLQVPQNRNEERQNGIGSASTLKEIVYEKQQTENIKKIYSQPAKRENDYNDDDLQYAAKYAFGYRIRDMQDGNDFGHEEKRNGRSAEGSYYVLLPDGRRQKVAYYADDSGYHAKVTYENVAQHEQ